MSRARIVLFALIALFHVAHASADEPFLVKDILDGLGAPSYPSRFIEYDGKLYFTADNGTEGRELWRSNGTEQGTELVIDLHPGSGGSSPTGLVVYDGLLYFSADDGLHGRELWVTDGSAAGTELVEDIARGPASGLSTDPPPVEAGGVLVFAADDGLHGRELWVSDGTAVGTKMVEDVYPGATGSNPRYLVELAGEVLFVADDSIHGRELWKMGAAGLNLVLDIHATSHSGIGALHKADPTTVVMGASDGTHGGELWITDGTAAGTQMLADLCASFCSSNPHAFISRNFVVGGVLQTQLYFSAYNSGVGEELWVSDLTRGGTKMLGDLNPGSGSSDPSSAVFAGPVLFFSAYDSTSGRELWKSDGSVGGTRQVADLNPGIANGIGLTGDRRIGLLGARVIFGGDDGTGAGNELRTFDGSSISLLLDVLPGPGSSDPENFFRWNNHLVFTAEGLVGTELGITDGTSNGTDLLKDIHEGTRSSYPTNLVAFGDSLLFSAGHDEWGSELWRSDGTAAGTVLVRDIRPGAESSFPSSLTVVGDQVYFTADDGTHGRELWRTDGTEAGTTLVADLTLPGSSIFYGLRELDGLLVFALKDVAHGAEPWLSDGTAAGTFLIKDIYPGPDSGLKESTWHTVRLGGELYFRADDGVHGGELWKTNGTRIGTVMVADVHPSDSALDGLTSQSLVRFDDWIVFAADDGTFGREPWLTDGTAAGTRRIADIQPGAGGSSPGAFQLVGGSVFFTAYESTLGTELWKTDGTPAGTERISDLDSDPNYEVLVPLPPAGGQFFFAALTDDTGVELWLADGSPEGSRLLRDINPGESDSWPAVVGESNGRLLFSAYEEVSGDELWVSDGSEAGTTLRTDLFEGGASSYPGRGVHAAGTFFFTAQNADYGNELWAIRPSCPGSLDLFERSLIADTRFEATGDVLLEQTSIANGADVSVTAGTAVRFGDGFRLDGASRLRIVLDPAADCE